jgi:DNA-binding transcriptional ArsR family regulator
MTNRLDQLFSALSDPTRRAVVERLARGQATVSELADPHDMALPTFLRHLRVLEEAGLVRTIKKGRVRTCHMEGGAMNEVQGWLAWQREVWEGRLDRLQALAEHIERNDN